MEPEPPGAASFCLEPESAPGPWPSGAGAAQKSGGSATLGYRISHSTVVKRDYQYKYIAEFFWKTQCCESVLTQNCHQYLKENHKH